MHVDIGLGKNITCNILSITHTYFMYTYIIICCLQVTLYATSVCLFVGNNKKKQVTATPCIRWQPYRCCPLCTGAMVWAELRQQRTCPQPVARPVVMAMLNNCSLHTAQISMLQNWEAERSNTSIAQCWYNVCLICMFTHTKFAALMGTMHSHPQL